MLVSFIGTLLIQASFWNNVSISKFAATTFLRTSKSQVLSKRHIKSLWRPSASNFVFLLHSTTRYSACWREQKAEAPFETSPNHRPPVILNHPFVFLHCPATQRAIKALCPTQLWSTRINIHHKPPQQWQHSSQKSSARRSWGRDLTMPLAKR